jgi:hypothetical protein
VWKSDYPRHQSWIDRSIHDLCRSTLVGTRRFTSHTLFHKVWLAKHHAPAWGATCWRLGRTLALTCFNPRAGVGRDLCLLWPAAPAHRSFNPRARVGRDPGSTSATQMTRCFNPRAGVGREVIDSGKELFGNLFQSTRRRGARPFRFCRCYRKEEFQSTRPPGARPNAANRTAREFVRTAGCIIARKRPGTAKGLIFLSVEDETGIANVIITPDLYKWERLLVTRSKFLRAEGYYRIRMG